MSDPTLIPVDPSDQSATEVLPKRRRGAQPGNLNALRHGYYARELGMSSPGSLSEKEMRNLLGEAAMLKDFMFILYQRNIESTDTAVLAETLRALSLASMALSRLLMVHQHIRYISTSDDGATLTDLLSSLDSVTRHVSHLPG